MDSSSGSAGFAAVLAYFAAGSIQKVVVADSSVPSPVQDYFSLDSVAVIPN